MDKLIASLVRMQDALREAGVASAVVGAMALAVWGDPRYTKDVDLKIMLDRDDADKLLAILPAGTVPLGPPHDMIERSGLLFVHDATGVRIDLLLADIGFDEEAIRRAVRMELGPGASAEVCSAEDLLIYKLLSTREKDHIDATTIVRRRGRSLDADYIRGWLVQFEEALADSTLLSTFESLMRRAR